MATAAVGANSTPAGSPIRNSISGSTTLSTQRPPFVNQFELTSGTLGYDPANASVLGRQISLLVVKRWGQ